MSYFSLCYFWLLVRSDSKHQWDVNRTLKSQIVHTSCISRSHNLWTPARPRHQNCGACATVSASVITTFKSSRSALEPTIQLTKIWTTQTYRIIFYGFSTCYIIGIFLFLSRLFVERASYDTCSRNPTYRPPHSRAALNEL